jgi:Co/Zn/Cd efflux system component
MCSAWTHVCADTLRSVAVLIAAGFAYIFPQLLTPADADSWGAIVVSIIILISLGPLLQGLYLTACKIRTVWCEEEPGSKILILNV